MNRAYLEGYINTKYAETKVSSGGKTYTRFQLASGKKDAREYYSMTLWHDEYQSDADIIEGAYAHIECTPRAWKTDSKSGVDFTVRRIWIAPGKPAGKPSEKAAAEPYEDIDIPF